MCVKLCMCKVVCKAVSYWVSASEQDEGEGRCGAHLDISGTPEFGDGLSQGESDCSLQHPITGLLCLPRLTGWDMIGFFIMTGPPILPPGVIRRYKLFCKK